MSQQNAVSNRLLSKLPPDDFQRFVSLLEPIDLPRGFVLAEKDQHIGHVYFLESGIGSIIAESPEGQRVEAGLFGRDGCTPPTLVLGTDISVYDIFMQVAGSGHRIETRAYLKTVETIAGFQRLLLLYVHTLNVQTSFTALSNAVHQIDERLARWLLMCHDRVDGDELALTHEFLSLMLAVRRPSVTTALHILEGNRFIRAERGYITITNRQGLEEFAADAYGKPEGEYQRLIGNMR